ncbi:MAG: alanine racemase [Oscillospiraceae bacterium]|nr:alanine racemase [Oscillospiraceae bacterium]
MESTLRRTWAEINLDNLIHNYKRLRAHVGDGVKFLGVVKADAYGHGALHSARVLQEQGADYLAVSSLDEARELRHHGITIPILLLGHTPAEEVPLLLQNDITQTVTCEAKALEYDAEARKCGGKLKIHIKLDTGMSRLGFLCDGVHFESGVEGVLRACRLENLEAEGIFTHFAAADEQDEESVAFTRKQFALFNRVVSVLEEKGVHFALRHCANSGAVANYPETYLDMVRPGILLYGYGEHAEKLGVKPVMSLKSVVNTIKIFEADTDVSYGRLYTTDKRSRLGVLPIGYADGFFRCLSNRCSLATKYGPAPLRGRICMDMCMIDLSELPEIQVGDEVEIFGSNNSLDALAELAGTIPYELTCAVSKRVPRVFIAEGKEIGRELRLLD